jgi:16S rRNA (cytosine1402-N4)-methyltransferase
MVDEVLELLAPSGNEVIVDCTLGLGGHAEAILGKDGFTGQVIGIDRDRAALDIAGKRLAKFGARFRALHGCFGQLGRLLEECSCGAVDGVLFDLGVSSLQLDDAARGFSFMRSGPLDMRMDQSCGQSAAALLARLDAADLADVLWDYGEERCSRRIAMAIGQARAAGPIADTAQLREIVHRVMGAKQGRIDSATRTFQALRIAVNDELGELERGLDGAAAVLAPGGRLAVLSFHSLEDRMVKRFLRGLAARPGVQLLTRGARKPSATEALANPRARSARLRGLRRDEAAGGCAP